MQLTQGQKISWLNYSEPGCAAEPETGTVDEVTTSATKGQIAQCTAEDGEIFEVWEIEPGGTMVSGFPPDPLTVRATAAGIEPPVHGSKVSNPGPLKPASDDRITAGILYHGPAYQQAVDMLVDMFGPQMSKVGHIPGPPEAGNVTLYCFLIEDESQMQDIAQTIRHHKHARFFEPNIETDLDPDMVKKAEATAPGGELPTLARV
jgi:hypothetical protein